MAWATALAVTLIGGTAAAAEGRPTLAAPVAADVGVCFTPGTDCEHQIVTAIDGARSSIRVQAYGFTAQPILHALRMAAQRGVSVELVLDRTGNFDKDKRPRRYSPAGLMAAAGAAVWIDNASGIAHNKIIVIDRRLTIGGSYNYTANAAKKNRENVTFIQSKEVAAAYLENWEARRAVSVDFVSMLRSQ